MKKLHILIVCLPILLASCTKDNATISLTFQKGTAVYADIEEIRLIALNVGNKTTTNNNFSSENPYFVFRNLELDEDECYYCYANYSAPHDDFADTNCGTAHCPCHCTFSLLPWVDQIASCTDEFVNVDKVC